MNKFSLALMGAAALTFGSAAQATVTLGSGSTVKTTGPTVTGNTTTIGYSDATLASPTFFEKLVFSNDMSGLYSMTLTTSSPDIDFTSVMLDGPGSASYSLYKAFDDTVSEFWTLSSPLTLDPGKYTLAINGNNRSAGSLGGSVTISAVPEPGTWAMMLIGFGAVGFAMRRGRKQAIPQLA